MNSIFTHRDKNEGKAGIGKLPQDLQSILNDISTEYHHMIPDKKCIHTPHLVPRYVSLS